MATPIFDRSFGFLLHDIARLLRKRFDQRARGLGLSRAQWQVLAHLHRHEGINQRGLSEILEIKSVTLGRLVDRLEAAGWVERRADPRDRRAHRLYTTGKVAPVLDRMFAIGEKVRAEALVGLGANEREGLIAALLTIRTNLSERGPDAAATDAPAERAGDGAADAPREVGHG
jgi:MarR family transcriptional regulator, transcriptional regulator for hemolysin